METEQIRLHFFIREREAWNKTPKATKQKGAVICDQPPKK